MESVQSFWLSRLSTLAAAVFAYCGVSLFTRNPRGRANRLALAYNAVFTAWSLGAVFWYSAASALAAKTLYERFCWCWVLFSPLVLHFDLELCGWFAGRSKGASRAALAAIYGPAVPLLFLLPFTIDLPEFRSGYWSLRFRLLPVYFAFVAYYMACSAAAVTLMLRSAFRATERHERARYFIIGWTAFAMTAVGFVSDSVFIVLGIDFPNLAIFCGMALSASMLIATVRFGLLAPLPVAEAPRILDALADFVVYFSEDGRVAWANGSALAAMGRATPAEARGTAPEAFLEEEEASRVRLTAQGGAETFGSRTWFGPGRVPVDLHAYPVENQPRGAILTALNLSAAAAKDRAERYLADTGLILEEFIGHTLDGIVVYDDEGRVALWNEALASATGIDDETALGKHGDEIVRMLGVDDPSAAEWTVSRPDGSRRILRFSRFPIPLRTGMVTAAIVRDVTEERRAEEETIERIRKLDHAQKMDAVGALTSGIAHDFNNNLAGIVGSLSLIRFGIASGTYSDWKELDDELELMEKSAERASSSVKRLLSLTKKRPPENVVFRLDEAVRRIVEFAARSMDPSVSLEVAPGLPEAHVAGDSGQIEQLLLNLIINAEHAMTLMRSQREKRGGRIDVFLKSFTRDAGDPEPEQAEPGREYWTLSIRDEGVGIAPDTATRIFEPFFTTKHAENSSGLGLAMVHSIARQHGGFVGLSSKPGKGSEFFVYLPAADPVSATNARSSPELGSGTVLVADDDRMPRDSAVGMLKALGYEARAVASGEEAVRAFEREPAAFVCVMLDLRMAGMGGDEAAVRMRKRDPAVPIVIATGYASDETVAEAEPSSGFVFLAKPYSLVELGQAIKEARVKASKNRANGPGTAS